MTIQQLANEDDRSTANARTLARGLALLEGVARESKGAGVTDLAAQVGIDKGTASRLLTTLRRLGYLRQNPGDRRYLLSGKVLMLARGYDRQLNLVEVARPILTKLRDDTGQTVYLAVREGDHVLYVDQYEPDTTIRLASTIGKSLPMHITAMGRAMIAAMPQDEGDNLLADLLARPNPSGFTVDLDHVREEINRARSEGWATVDRYDDVTRIGAAIVDGGGEPIGSISVAGPSFLVAAHTERFSEMCIEAAHQISVLLS